jgi:hypothetical protein
MAQFHLSEIVELCFVMALAYAFYQQRQLFSRQPKNKIDTDEEEGDGRDDDYEVNDDMAEEDEEELATHKTQWPSVANYEPDEDAVRR